MAICRFRRSRMSGHLTTPASPSTRTRLSLNGPAAWEVSPSLKQASTARNSTSNSVYFQKHDCFWTHDEAILVHSHECNGQYIICSLGKYNCQYNFYTVLLSNKNYTYLLLENLGSFSIVLREGRGSFTWKHCHKIWLHHEQLMHLCLSLCLYLWSTSYVVLIWGTMCCGSDLSSALTYRCYD